MSMVSSKSKVSTNAQEFKASYTAEELQAMTYGQVQMLAQVNGIKKTNAVKKAVLMEKLVALYEVEQAQQPEIQAHPEVESQDYEIVEVEQAVDTQVSEVASKIRSLSNETIANLTKLSSLEKLDQVRSLWVNFALTDSSETWQKSWHKFQDSSVYEQVTKVEIGDELAEITESKTEVSEVDAIALMLSGRRTTLRGLPDKG